MDFILTWVDEGDPLWRNTFNEWSSKRDEQGDKSTARFRDWGNLHFWFRGVEKFTPWVNKIHFVTFGSVPKWLNTKHPKLNIVKHEDFIPSKYLPTFNSRTIELNFHLISDLSEEYVLFNDDFFIINSLKPEHFFKNGKPCDFAIQTTLDGFNKYDRTLLRNLEVINKYFDKRQSMRSKIGNWFNFKYGINQLRTLLLLPWPRFTGFIDHHLPQPYLKSNLSMLWDTEGGLLDQSCLNKFRNLDSVNHYLQRYWLLSSNSFMPSNIFARGTYFDLHKGNNICLAENMIREQSKCMIALNDQYIDDFNMLKNRINDAFHKILPNKSNFEI